MKKSEKQGTPTPHAFRGVRVIIRFLRLFFISNFVLLFLEHETQQIYRHFGDILSAHLVGRGIVRSKRCSMTVWKMATSSDQVKDKRHHQQGPMNLTITNQPSYRVALKTVSTHKVSQLSVLLQTFFFHLSLWGVDGGKGGHILQFNRPGSIFLPTCILNGVGKTRETEK